MLKIKNDPVQMVLEVFEEMYPKSSERIKEIYYASFYGEEKIVVSEFEDGIMIAIRVEKQSPYKIAKKLKIELLKIALDMDRHNLVFEKSLEKFNKKIEYKIKQMFDY